MQCHQAAKQQDIDTDAESIMGDVTEKQQITMAIPQVRQEVPKRLNYFIRTMQNQNSKHFPTSDCRCRPKRII